MKKIILLAVALHLILSSFAMSNEKPFSQEVEFFLTRLNQISDEELPRFFLDSRALKNQYIGIDRSQFSSDQIYENEYLLRFVNQRIIQRVQLAKDRGSIPGYYFEPLLFEAQIYSDNPPPSEKNPQKTLPIYSVHGSPITFSDWIDDEEFSNYRFKGDEVVYRGLKIHSGDVILNHPAEKPVGAFTSLADEPNSFSHSAIVVFFERGDRKIPAVLDAHEKGVRAVPLNVFLSPQVITYAEIFRFKEDVWTPERQQTLAREAESILTQDFPYDLTGSPAPDALSCVELVNFLIERSGLMPFPIQKGISDDIYQNILHFGEIQNQFINPAQVAMSPSLMSVGYIDNGASLMDMVANEAIFKVFRDTLAYGVLKTHQYPFADDLGLVALNFIQDPNSILGKLILKLIGFTPSNFPRGSKEILVSINRVNQIAAMAFEQCTLKNDSECSQAIQDIIKDSDSWTTFSMIQTIRDPRLFNAAEKAMAPWVDLFKN